ncbi:hypothetical protein Bpfe_008302 [Biomphalaria pfeifferi]|uniref:Uncharacterized protein n=1 Tax=Biomphalaria pfeifferi TaxID=112525 RepID=A0AAD8BWM9_BIOPF|nr:hypothetical protein Bpfe_008302 [Biomphalaria pfeifferi]
MSTWSMSLEIPYLGRIRSRRTESRSDHRSEPDSIKCVPSANHGGRKTKRKKKGFGGVRGDEETEKVSVSKGMEEKVSVSKGMEEKVSVSKGMEEKVSVSKGMEEKVSVSKGMEEKVSVSKGMEEKVSVSKGMEEKVSVSKGMEEKVWGSTWRAGRVC